MSGPPLLNLAHYFRKGKPFTRNFYKGLVLAVTFLTYAAFHATRKPPSIVKSVLHGDTDRRRLGDDTHLYSIPPSGVLRRLMAADPHYIYSHTGPIGKRLAAPIPPPPPRNTGWAPFNTEQGKSLLGQCDLAFLASYAFGLFFLGHLGDSMDLRTFLTIGMFGTGLFTILFGMGYFREVHDFWYYAGVQICAGLFQSFGWPSVVAVMGNWFGKGKRGLIMGIWNAHTSVGNIAGSMAAAALLSSGWGWSFTVPGFAIGVLGLLVFLTLPPEPKSVGLKTEEAEAQDRREERRQRHREERRQRNRERAREREELQASLIQGGGDAAAQPAAEGGELSAGGAGTGPQGAAARGVASGGGGGADSGGHAGSVSFMTAWRIPGVAAYALCLFFAKLIAYTFLYWLPYYIKETKIGGRKLTPKEAGDLSVLFDFGGIAGGIAAGHLSDKTSSSAVVSSSFLLLSVPALYLYSNYGHLTFTLNIGLMMIGGFFVNGPYALITTAVSADLGTHECLRGSSKALATVTAIIDGFGSLGAALGPLLTGYISSMEGGFNNVFHMLYASAVCAALLISRLVARELALAFSKKPAAPQRRRARPQVPDDAVAAGPSTAEA